MAHRPQPDQRDPQQRRATRSPTARSTPRCIGLHEEPRLPEVQPRRKPRSWPRRTRPRTAAQFSVVLEHTNDPANTREAELIKEQLAKAGHRRHAEAGGPDRVHHRRGHRATSASCCGATTPATTPTRSTTGGTPAPRSTSASSTTRRCRRCSTRAARETDPAKRKQIYQQVNKRFASQVYNVWAYYADVGRSRRTRRCRASPVRRCPTAAAPEFSRRTRARLYGRADPCSVLYVTK